MGIFETIQESDLVTAKPREGEGKRKGLVSWWGGRDSKGKGEGAAQAQAQEGGGGGASRLGCRFFLRRPMT